MMALFRDELFSIMIMKINFYSAPHSSGKKDEIL